MISSTVFNGKTGPNVSPIRRKVGNNKDPLHIRFLMEWIDVRFLFKVFKGHL